MTTYEMVALADKNNKTYKRNDVYYTKSKGFYGEGNYKFEVPVFSLKSGEGLSSFIRSDGWEEVKIPENQITTMKKWIMPRGAGKTTHLIYEAYNKNAIIVAKASSLIYINELAKRMNVDIKPPITFERFLVETRGRDEKYLIDELDLYLKGLNIIGYSNSSDDII